ncbi:hypothetical protein [Thermoanaerobacterium saccharolyticum]|uniref:hypothetical protein n=1 Tax=Thermoanaerobacterium saccharolyticum TaxID=28896 RepID=UPI0005EF6922
MSAVLRSQILSLFNLKKGNAAAVEALKDYNSMQYIIEHSDEDIYEVETRMTSPHSAKIIGVPGKHNSKSGEERLDACLDEIDVLKERYRRALEYMEWFKPAWEALSEKEQFILTEFFVNDVSKTEAVANIGEKLFLERAQVYRRKDKALNHLALLLYGK